MTTVPALDTSATFLYFLFLLQQFSQLLMHLILYRERSSLHSPLFVYLACRRLPWQQHRQRGLQRHAGQQLLQNNLLQADFLHLGLCDPGHSGHL